MTENVTTGARPDPAGRRLRVVGAVFAGLLLVGVVALTVTGYRADNPEVTQSTAEDVLPWVVFLAGVLGVVVCGALGAARRSDRARA
ncbi:hypothetical protein [Cellulomonas sp. URHB0016]